MALLPHDVPRDLALAGLGTPPDPALPRVGAQLDPRWRAHAPREWTEGTRRRVPVAGGWVEVEERGYGRPLLMLPPLPGWKEAWSATAPLLARTRRTAAVDLRMHFVGRPSWQALLEDLDRVADTLGDEPLDVIGHSLGGALALRWAIERPGRVRRLVLSSAFARVTTPKGDLVRRWIEQPLVLAAGRWLPDRAAAFGARELAARGRWVLDRHCDDAVLSFVRHGIRSVSPAHAMACVRLAFEHDVRSRLPQLDVPTLVVVGERETAFAHQAADELWQGIAGSRLAVSPDSAHLHPLSRPHWLAEHAAAWLDGARSPDDPD